VVIRWQAQVLSVLAKLRDDPAADELWDGLAETLESLEVELALDGGKGHMWIVPVTTTGWVLACVNDEPDTLVITYLGPALEP
jgi:hypothetical protein